MLIAPMQQIRAANPGIVPSSLQREGQAITSEPRTAALTAMCHGSHDAHIGAQLDGSGDVHGEVSTAAGQAQLEAVVGAIQARFGALGVQASEGNGPVVARFSPRYPNAYYTPNGDPRYEVPADSIVVGSDPRSGKPFFQAPDVVAHELSHRIIDHMTHGKLNLSPLSEDVAVHESLADTFASLIDDDDWVIGDQLAEPIRVMNDPGQLGHPGHIDDLEQVLAPTSPFMRPVGQDRRTGEDILAPDWHVVAGIPNKAATLIGDELGRDKLGEIYFRAVREHVRPGQRIEGLASSVIRSAHELYGANSHELQTTIDAWDAVGVLDLIKR